MPFIDILLSDSVQGSYQSTNELEIGPITVGSGEATSELWARVGRFDASGGKWPFQVCREGDRQLSQRQHIFRRESASEAWGNPEYLVPRPNGVY
jgi:hypothetical protein